MASILIDLLRHGLAGLLVGSLYVWLRGSVESPRTILQRGTTHSVTALLVYWLLDAIF